MTQKIYGVGIIGCGLIGQKRSKSLGNEGKLIACADIDLVKAELLAKGFGAKSYSSWKELLMLSEIDIIIIATLHDSLAEITSAAIKAGKHVLVEKPAARNVSEIEKIIFDNELREQVWESCRDLFDGCGRFRVTEAILEYLSRYSVSR